MSPSPSFLRIGGRGSEPLCASLWRDKVFGAELRILHIQVKPDKESNNREGTKQCVIVGTAPHSFTALSICHSGFCSKINIVNGSGKQIYTELKEMFTSCVMVFGSVEPTVGKTYCRKSCCLKACNTFSIFYKSTTSRWSVLYSYFAAYAHVFSLICVKKSLLF